VWKLTLCKGYGDGWFKLWDETYDADQQKWCTNKMIDNKGLLSVVIPKGLQGGYYLIRTELLALHNAAKGDPQFFVGCAQVFLEDGGNLGPTETVSIPGYIDMNNPAMTWNIYTGTDPTKYPHFGPEPATFANGASAKAEQGTQDEGGKPADCILENGSNFCGVEVPEYSTEQGCWDACTNCWDQNQACWNSTQATGGDNCKIWQAKCQQINDNCNAGNYNGPPNKDKDLTPQPNTVDVGQVWPTQAGANVEQAKATSAPQMATPSTPVYTSTPVSTPYATEKSSSYQSSALPMTTAAPSDDDVYTKVVTVTEEIVETTTKYITVYNKGRRHEPMRYGKRHNRVHY
jgi:hypothetical protein